MLLLLALFFLLILTQAREDTGEVKSNNYLYIEVVVDLSGILPKRVRCEFNFGLKPVSLFRSKVVAEIFVWSVIIIYKINLVHTRSTRRTVEITFEVLRK